MKYYLVLATVLAVCSLCGAYIEIASSILGHQYAVEVGGQNKVPASRKIGAYIGIASLTLGHQHAVKVTGENKVPASCKVAPLNNYYKFARALLQKCQSRIGGNDSDVEALSTYHPIKTEVQKKLVHCALQLINIICGDFLADIDYLAWAYVYFQDGDPLKFIDVTAKLQECYNAAKEFDGVDGMEAMYALYHCFLNQWKQDDKKRAES